MVNLLGLKNDRLVPFSRPISFQLNQFLICVLSLAYLYLSIDNDRHCCLTLNLVMDQLGLDKELDDLVLENQQYLKSVQETCENLFSEMERIIRCQRSQFVSSAFSQNHIKRQKQLIFPFLPMT